ncbi:MAG: hypothetical protein QXD23_02935 [Candidatus Micrarchaeaceae archaeon]
MDLLSKTIIGVIIIIAVIFVFYYLQSNGIFGTYTITQSQAKALVLNDLQNTFQNAVINITNVSKSQYQGSWHIIAAIVQNSTSPCPDYSVVSFDYPKYNFVYKIENVYTQNCVIYQKGLNQSSIISSYPTAIIKSYESNLTLIKNYVNKYGFNNVSVYANYFSNLKYLSKNYTDIWEINYTTTKSNNVVSVLLYESNGMIAKTYNAT